MFDHPDDQAHRAAAIARYAKLRKNQPITMAAIARRAGLSDAAAHSWESGARDSGDCRVEAILRWSTLIGHPATITLVDVASPPTPGIEVTARMLATAPSESWTRAFVAHTWERLESAVRWSLATPEEIATRSRMDHLKEINDDGEIIAHLVEVAARCGISATGLALALRFQRPPMVSTWQSFARAVGGRCEIEFADDPFGPTGPS